MLKEGLPFIVQLVYNSLVPDRRNKKVCTRQKTFPDTYLCMSDGLIVDLFLYRLRFDENDCLYFRTLQPTLPVNSYRFTVYFLFRYSFDCRVRRRFVLVYHPKNYRNEGYTPSHNNLTNSLKHWDKGKETGISVVFYQVRHPQIIETSPRIDRHS